MKYSIFLIVVVVAIYHTGQLECKVVECDKALAVAEDLPVLKEFADCLDHIIESVLGNKKTEKKEEDACWKQSVKKKGEKCGGLTQGAKKGMEDIVKAVNKVVKDDAAPKAAKKTIKDVLGGVLKTVDKGVKDFVNTLKKAGDTLKGSLSV